MDKLQAFTKKFNKQKAKQPKGGGGDRKAPAWAQRRKAIRMGPTPVWVWLYPGEYEDGMPLYEYWATWLKRDGRNRFILCNCHGGQREGAKCLLCHKMQEEENDHYIPKPRVAINAIELADFHKIEKKSEKGTVWYEYERCAGTDALGRNLCKYCDAKIETVYGRRGFLNLGKGYWNNFQKVMEEARKICKTCGGSLHLLRYVCAECDEVFLDPAKSTVTEEQRQEMETKDTVCPMCVHKGPAKKVVGCFKKDEDTDKFVKGCDTPIPSDIFDFPLLLSIEGEGPGSTLTCDVQQMEPQEMPDEVQAMMVPYDFESFFGEMPVTEQANIMGVNEVPKHLLAESEGGDASAEPSKPKTINYE